MLLSATYGCPAVVRSSWQEGKNGKLIGASVVLALQSDDILLLQQYFGNNKYSSPAGTSCRACTNSFFFSITSQFSA